MTYATRRPDIADHEIVDLSKANRVLAFGDVHGRLDLLIQELAEIDFGPTDVAICVGDWMDRGTATMPEMKAFLDATPNILWTRGNHEDILRNACHEGGRRSVEQSGGDLVKNGGLWVLDHLTDDGDDARLNDDVVAFADMLNDAPIAMTVITPGGRRIGIVHAAVPGQSWDGMVAALEGPDPRRESMAHHCMWDRDAADTAMDRRAADQAFGFFVDGIDHVFHGHTVVGREPMTFGNTSWVDTGAYKTGILTMVDIDAFLTDLGEPSPHAR